MSRIPGPPTSAFRKVYFADADATVLNGGTIEDTGGSLRFTVPGSAATPDLSSAVVALWRAKDILGSAITTADGAWMAPHMVKILEKAAPSLTSDTWVGCGFVNTATLGDAEGSLAGLVYTGGAREIRAGEFLNGVTTSTDSGAVASLASVIGAANMRNGGDIGHSYATGYDGSDYTAHLSQSQQFIVVDFVGDLYFYVAAGRTSAAVGSVVVDVDAGHSPLHLISLSSGF